MGSVNRTGRAVTFAGAVVAKTIRRKYEDELTIVKMSMKFDECETSPKCVKCGEMRLQLDT